MESEPRFAVVLITSPGEQARRIADMLLEKRKAACVNIVPKVDSLYWWQGRIQADAESLLIVKTQFSLVDDIITLVKGVHSYKVPEIIALPVIGGSADYLSWLAGEVLVSGTEEEKRPCAEE